jgi:hypothetical protein
MTGLHHQSDYMFTSDFKITIKYQMYHHINITLIDVHNEKN